MPFGSKFLQLDVVGGVHHGSPFDISAGLPTLAQIPMIVVCLGTKAILDLKATKENLETNAVPILGYKTNKLPAFFQ